MAEEFTSKFKVDISDLKKSLADARNEIKLANAAFKAGTAGMDDWTKDADGLTKKLEQLQTVLKSQKTILNTYKQQLEQAEDAEQDSAKRADELRAKLKQLADQGVDKASDEYKKYAAELKKAEAEQDSNEKSVNKLRLQVLNAEAAVGKTEKELRQYENALDQAERGVEDLSRAEDRANDTTGKLGDGFTVLKGAMASLVADGIRKVASELKSLIVDGAKYADDLLTLSKQTSVSTDTLQRYGYMADLVDVEVGTVAKSMQKLTKSMSSASKGTGSAYKAFEKLGVNITDSNGALRDNEDVFNDVIGALGKMTNETERDATAMDLFGKSATNLNPLIEAGADQIAAWNKEAEEMGYIMDEEALAGMSALQDSFDRFNLQITAIKNNVSAGLAPAVSEGADQLRRMVSDVDWKAFGQQIGEAFKWLLSAFEWIVTHGAEVSAVLSGIIAAFAAYKIMQIVQGIGTMTKALTTMNAAANANPYVLLVSVLVGLAAATVSWAKSLKDAYNESNYFIKGVKDATATINEHTQIINDMASAYDEARTAREENMNAGLAEMAHIETLTAELATLADENGKVAEKDQSRAQFILGELNTALGTEYEMQDGIIQQYKDMQAAVDELIQKKRAEIILQSQEEAYRQAITGRADAERELETAIQNKYNAERKLGEISAEITSKQAEMNKEAAKGSQAVAGLGVEISLLKQAYNEAKDSLGEYDKAIQKSADVVDQYAHDVTQYEDNATKAITGNYKKIQYESWETAKAQGEASNAASQAVITGAEAGTQAWSDSLGAMVSEATGKKVEFKDAGEGMVQAYVDGQKYGEEMPATQVQVMAQKMMFQMQALANKMGDSGANAVAGLANGVNANAFMATNAGRNLAEQLLAGFRSRMDEHSPSKEMIKSGKNAVLGAVKGIDDNKKLVNDSASSLASGIVNTMKTVLKINGGVSEVTGAVGKSIALGVIKGADEMKGDLMKSAEKYAKPYVDAANQRRQDMKKSNEPTIQNEIAFWKEMVKAAKEGTDDYKTAAANLKLAKKDLAAQVKAANAEIRKAEAELRKNEKQTNAKIKELTSTLKKDTKKIKKQLTQDIEKTLTTYDEKVGKIRENLRKNWHDIQENTSKEIASIRENLTNEINSLWDNYYNAVDSRKQSIMDSMNLFGTVKLEDWVSKDDLMRNLNQQVEALDAWNKVLNNLRGRIKNQNLLAELEKQGVGSLQLLQSIDSMSNEQLRDYEALYEKKEQIAENRALTENQNLLRQTEYQVELLKQKAAEEEQLVRDTAARTYEELRTAAEQEVQELTVALAEDIQALRVAASNQISALRTEYKNQLKELAKETKKQGKEIGNNLAEGIGEGFNKQMPAIAAEIQRQVQELVNSIRRQMKIASPSKVFASIGDFMAQGLGVGFVDRMKQVRKDIAQSMPNIAANNMLGGLQNAALATSAGTVNNSSMARTTNFTQIINAPQQPSRIELYRQTKNLLELAERGA